MNNYKTLAIKFLCIFILLIGFNYLYKFIFFEKDLQKHADIINLVRKVVNEKDEIIYVGESSNITTRGDDEDKRAISDFISEYFPSIKCGSITKEASHAGIYYELLRNIPENSSVKTVIVTLNLRSFDANWIYSNLETPLQKSILLLKKYPPLFNRFLLSFGGYDIKTELEREKQFKEKWENDILKFPKPFKYKNVIEWDNAMANQGIKNSDGTINYPLTELACHYIKTYAFQIDTQTNPRIKDFDKIVLLAKERNWNLIFNLMSENTAKANELVGEDLVYLIKQNRDLLVKRYSQKNVLVVDNLEAVPNSEFVDQNWTTEHYAENGRKIIAKNVSNELKKLYPNDFHQVTYKKIINQDEFINNCEGDIIWGQMQTISNDKAFSGSKSSKTGNKQDYSVTFEYSIKKLPDSIKQVSINFQLFQTEINNESKLVIEISGKNIEYQWNGIAIKDLSQTTEKWNEINYLFSLPMYFKNGDLIKIYVYNLSNSLIYIDDIRIKFLK